MSGPPPVSSIDDLTALLPAFLKPNTPAPVRDALLQMTLQVFLAYQEAAAYAVAQSDLGRATGIYEDGLLEDHGFARQSGEVDTPFRTRALGTQLEVTPAGILAAVNAILDTVGAPHASYFEPALDRMFITDGTGGYHSFIGTGPDYPDRQYTDSLTSTSPVAGRAAGHAWIFGDVGGRYFVLRTPDLAALDQSIQLVFNGTKVRPQDTAVPELGGAVTTAFVNLGPGELSASLGGTGLYISNGSDTAGTESDGRFGTPLYQSLSDSNRIYAAIVNTVEQIKGMGVRWMLYADPSVQ